MPNQLTQAELLAAVDRVLDEGYLAPLKAFGDGYELLQGFAKVGERCSLAVRRFELDGFIMSSGGASRATVTLKFYRPTAAAGDGVVLAGTLVRASVGGQVFRTIEDASFAGGVLEVTVAAVSIGYGYQYNVAGPYTDPSGVVWPGLIDTVDLPLEDPPFFDDTIQVTNTTAATGGRPATLDALGNERSLPRQANESDGNYAVRIRTLPDTVAPNAIMRQLRNYFRAYNVRWRAVETWQHEWQECYDAPDEPGTTYETFDANLFCYDDPRPATPMQNRWMGENDHLGAFVVEVTHPQTIEDYGFAYDDTADDIAGVQTPIGIRAFAAYDVPDSLSPPALAPCYDGVDFGAEAFFGNLYDMLDEIKAGGMFITVALADESVAPVPWIGFDFMFGGLFG